MNNLYYLSHGGPGSGRYPLGSGERPYQKFEGSRKSSRGISGYIKSRKEKRAEANRLKVEKEAAQKKIELERQKQKHDADKERVLREGTASEVLKYKGELSNKELQDVYTRLSLESNLHNLSQKEIKTSMDKIDNIMKNIKTGTEWAKIGTEAYNTFAAIYNATSDGKKNPLTLVSKGSEKKK